MYSFMKNDNFDIELSKKRLAEAFKNLENVIETKIATRTQEAKMELETYQKHIMELKNDMDEFSSVAHKKKIALDDVNKTIEYIESILSKEDGNH